MLKPHSTIGPLFLQHLYSSLFPEPRFLTSVLSHYSTPPTASPALKTTQVWNPGLSLHPTLNKTRNTEDEILASPKQNILPQATTTKLIY